MIESELEVRAAVVLPYRGQDTGRRQGLGIRHDACRGRKCVSAFAAPVRCVERRSDWLAFEQQLPGPFVQLCHFVVFLQAHPWLTSAGGGQLFVAADGGDLLRRVRGTIAEQAVQKENIQEPDRMRCDTYWGERIQIHCANLEVLHAPLA